MLLESFLSYLLRARVTNSEPELIIDSFAMFSEGYFPVPTISLDLYTDVPIWRSSSSNC